MTELNERERERERVCVCVCGERERERGGGGGAAGRQTNMLIKRMSRNRHLTKLTPFVSVYYFLFLSLI